MNCERTRERLGRFIDNELPPALQRAVEAHVDDCAECTAELKRLRVFVSHLADGEREPVPANLWGAIERELDRSSSASNRPERIRIRYRGLATAAMIGLAALIGWIGLDRLERTAGRAQAASIDFSVLLDALPLDAEKALSKFLMLYQGRRIAPYEAQRHAPRLNFAIPERLPGGFSLEEVYALRFGSDDGIAARYARDGEMLVAVFHPPIHEDAYGTHNDLPCVVGEHRGHKVQVGDWKLVHLTDPTTCHCVLSRLDERDELPAVMAAVAPSMQTPPVRSNDSP